MMEEEEEDFTDRIIVDEGNVIFCEEDREWIEKEVFYIKEVNKQ